MVAFEGTGVGMRMATATGTLDAAAHDDHVARITERRPHLSMMGAGPPNTTVSAAGPAPDAGPVPRVGGDEPQVRVLGLPTMFRLVIAT